MEEKKIFADHEVFEQIKEPKNRYQETDSARLHSLAGRYDNPIPTRFLAPLRLFKNSSTKDISWNRFLGSINVYK